MFILILRPNPFTSKGFTKLKKLGEVESISDLDSLQSLKKLSQADILITSSAVKLGRHILRKAKCLKLIITASSGYDLIDLDFAKDRKITVCNSPNYHTTSVAEYAFGLVISLSRRLVDASNSLQLGVWGPQNFQGVDLKNKVIGIVGYGRVGKEVGRIARAFGMKVLKVTAKSTKKEFSDLLRGSDIITIHAPLTNRTKNLIGSRELELVKRGVFIINTSRGGIINERSLLKALESGRVGAAALDVFEKEPLNHTHPFLNLKDVIATPHIASFTKEAAKRRSKEILLTLRSFLSGTPTNIVNLGSYKNKTNLTRQSKMGRGTGCVV